MFGRKGRPSTPTAQVVDIRRWSRPQMPDRVEHLPLEQIHWVTGRMSGASGMVTFCACGRSYFAPYVGPIEHFEADMIREQARQEADRRYDRHCGMVRPDRYPPP